MSCCESFLIMSLRKKNVLCLYLFLTILVSPLFTGASASAAHAGKAKETRGVIKGQVKNRWAKISRYPTLVYIEKIKGVKYKAPEQAVIMNQIEAKFVPRLMPVLKGTLVNFLNGDNIQHDIYTTDNEKYSLGEFAPGEQRSHRFNRLGPYVQLCRTHYKMKAYVLVLQNPVYTFTDDKGSFILPNVPSGNWKLKVFNEKMAREDTDKTFDVAVAAGFTSTVNAAW